MPWLHQSGADRLLFRKLYNDREKYLRFSRKQVMERTKGFSESHRKDIFYHLLRAKDPETGEGFSERELWGESNTLIIAGVYVSLRSSEANVDKYRIGYDFNDTHSNIILFIT